MKTDITVDLLYYGSLGIRQGNPNATTVLGGLCEGPTKEISVIKSSISEIYNDIGNRSGSITNSTNPDDYFQVACWHPYLWTGEPNYTSWVKPNQDIYDTINKTYHDTNKRVIFSEFGYSDNSDYGNNTSEEVAKYLNEAFQLAQEYFPWLDTIYWYRLIEEPVANNSWNPPGYGLFYMNWTWKPAAHTYQEIICPEYPTAIVLPLFIVTTLIAVIAYKKKYSMESNPRKRALLQSNLSLVSRERFL